MFEMHSQEADVFARAVSIAAETNTGIPDFNKGIRYWSTPWKAEEQIFEDADFYKVDDDHLLQGQDPLIITWNVGLVQYRSRFEKPYTFKKLSNKNQNFTGTVFKGKVYRYGHFTEAFEWNTPQFTSISLHSFSKFMGIRIIMKETENLLTVEHDSSMSLINLIGELGGTLKWFDMFSKLFIVVAIIIWIVKVLNCNRAYSRLKRIERMISPVDEDAIEERDHASTAIVIDDNTRPSAILMEPLIDNQDAS